MSEFTDKQKTGQDYLNDCFMQQCQNEIDAYNKDAEPILDKYSKLSIKYLPFMGIALASSLIIIHSSIGLKATSQLIGLFSLLFVITMMLVVRYYIKHKDNKEIRLDIYDAWKKTILGAIMVNFGLYIFSDNPHTEMLIVLAISAIALIVIQRGVKRSL